MKRKRRLLKGVLSSKHRRRRERYSKLRRKGRPNWVVQRGRRVRVAY